MSLSGTVLSSLLILALLWRADCCQHVKGCKIDQGRCRCATGCASEYRYPTRDECRQALNGEGRNACVPNPCAHDGLCIQTTSAKSKYKCRCEGTGYYGTSCLNACPTSGSDVKNYPYECIEI